MRIILATIALLSLAACTSAQPTPIGIGTGVNDLKRSPCACMPIPMDLKAYIEQAA